MRRLNLKQWAGPVALAGMVLGWCALPARGDVTTAGDSSLGGNSYIGNSGPGSLLIDRGSLLSGSIGYLGYNAGATGSVTVTGAGSKWTTSDSLYVGYNGAGTLTVADGGLVSTRYIFTSLADLYGDGTINISGGVLDANLVFDASHGVSQSLAFGTGGTLNLTLANTSTLGVGYHGNGSLRIADGLAVVTATGHLGYSSGATGSATVSGVGSKWTCSNVLYIGNAGSGTLTVDGGAQVSSASGYLGYNTGATGTVTVTGTGSTWTNSGSLYVGRSGAGILTVADGGLVTAKALYASTADLRGNGTITASGGVLDADLAFDAAHGTTARVAFGIGGTLNVTLSGTSELGAGYKGAGTLRVADGVAVNSTTGYLGLNASSTGAATVTGAGSKWTNSGSIYAGYTGAGTLTVDGGAQVSSASGYLGYNTGANGAATVTGAGSKWANSGSIYVGYSGPGTLTVDGGGQVSSASGYLGYNTGANGAAIVTGAGSAWNNSGSLYVGYNVNGTGTLTVSNSGLVSAQTLYAALADLRGNGAIAVTGGVLDTDLVFDSAHGATQTLAFGTGGSLNVTLDGSGALGVGYRGIGTLRVAEGVTVKSTTGCLGYNAGASGAATVTGAGSKWTNSGIAYVGYNGAGTLRVEAGAEVSGSNGYLGYNTGATGAATVTGTGSKWTNTNNLYVGHSGSGTLAVDSGAQVNNGTGFLGYNSGATGSVTVTGAGTTWTTNGYNLFLGYNGTGTLTIADGAQVSSASGYMSYNTGATGAATVTGTGSRWTCNNDLYVGFSGGPATLTVNGGAQVSSANGYLGYSSGATGAVTVTGTGSTWTNSGSLYVGKYGSGTLTVSDGGQVTAAAFYGGASDLRGNGTITASGGILDADLAFDAAHGTTARATFGVGGTLNVALSSTSELGAGYRSAGSVRISEGVSVTNDDIYLGYNAGATGAATVTGVGSTWIYYGSMLVGNNGAGTLTMDAGAQMRGNGGSLGYNAGASGAVTVTGAGSKWTTTICIYVGNSGTGTLTVADGAEISSDGSQVGNASAYVGYNSSGSGTVTVTGAGSKWTCKSDLYVSYNGSGSLSVTDGAQVSSARGYLGWGNLATGSVTVTGAGSTWTNSGSLRVGQYHSGTGILTVSDGGLVTTQTLYADVADLRGNGTITISGGGFFDADLVFNAANGPTAHSAFGAGGILKVTLDGANELGVGYRGVGNLRIADGVTIKSTASYLGRNYLSTGSATVTGVNSTWTNAALYIGYEGSGTLTVDAGAQVSSTSGFLGNNTGSTGSVTVAGTGSVWNISGALRIGYRGAGTMTIDGGAQVSNAIATLGSLTGIAGTATVSGSGSRWTNAGELTVGESSAGTLAVKAGAQVSNTIGFIGGSSGSTGSVTVTGAGSAWINAGTLYVSQSGIGTLTVADGAQVSNTAGHLGYNAGSTGSATVTGAGSTWTCSGDLSVGYNGTGALTVGAGARISSANGYIGRNTGATGTVTVSGTGATWTNSGTLYVGTPGAGTLTVADGAQVTANALYAAGSNLRGNGTITVGGGGYFDADLAFDAAHGTTAHATFGTGGTLNVSVDGKNELAVGYKGAGTLRIADGMTVVSTSGYLGYAVGATGSAVITGTGSAWTNSIDLNSSLYVGYDGTGSLTVSKGAQVSDSRGYIANNINAIGAATITGAGSRWTNTGDLYVGHSGRGTLIVDAGAQVNSTYGWVGWGTNSTATATVTGPGSKWTNSNGLSIGTGDTLTVADGGTVSAAAVNIYYPQGKCQLNVSGDGMLVLGTSYFSGTMSNAGTVAFYASPTLAPGTYRPITAYPGKSITWNDNYGTYTAIGGTWDNTAKTFTVAAVTALATGMAEPVGTGERLWITDAVSAERMGVSVGTVTGTPTFSASVMGKGDLAALLALIGSDKRIGAGWNFTTNYTGGEVLLSFDVGTEMFASDLSVWRLENGTWSPYSPAMLTYNSSGMADFTVSSFSGYAVVVPEPTGLAWLAIGGLALLRRRGRRK